MKSNLNVSRKLFGQLELYLSIYKILATALPLHSCQIDDLPTTNRFRAMS